MDIEKPIEEVIAEFDANLQMLQMQLDQTTQNAFAIKQEITRVELLKNKLLNSHQDDGS